MYLRTGLGIVGGPVAMVVANKCDLPFAATFSPECWIRAWDGLFPPPRVVAPVGAPAGPLLTAPPASGEQAQSTVDALIDQQMRDQQALNAAGVESSVIDRAASVAVDTGEAVSDAVSAPLGLPWWAWGLLGVGVFAVVATGGGSPQRYGR